MSEDPFTRGMEALFHAEQLRSSDALTATSAAYEALRLFAAVPTRRGMGAAHLLLGELSLFTTDLAEARDHLVQARDLFAAIPLPDLEAEARRTLAEVLVRFDDLDGARAELEVALELATDAGDVGAQAALLRRLGSVARRRGDVAAAVAAYQTSLALYTALDDGHGAAGVVLSMGNTLAAIGRHADARDAHRQAADLFATTGDRLGEANAWRFFAQAADRSGDTAEAEAAYHKALSGYLAVGDILGESYVRLALGESAAANDDLETARGELAQAVELFARTSEPVGIVEATRTLATAQLGHGDRAGALHTLCWGVAEARQAARWAVSAARRDHSRSLVNDLEATALDLAVALGEGTLAGEIIEGGSAGLVGLLPLLFDGPEPTDPRIVELRRRIRDVVTRLDAAGTDTPPPAADNDPGDGFRGGVRGDAAQDAAIAELERLLGQRAREVLSPRRIDFAATLETARAGRLVVQYSCPRGVAADQPLYVVWTTPWAPPQVARRILSPAVAARLDVLRGMELLRPAPSPATGPLPEEASVQRGLGLSGADAGAAAQVARRTYDLWTILDREPKADPVVAELAEVLFPAPLMDALRDLATGLPARLLVVPGRELWNLPWPGLPVPGGGRLIERARVSLMPSLSSGHAAHRGAPGVRRVTAWIPEQGAGTVRGTQVERTMVQAMFGPDALAGTPDAFLAALGTGDAAVTSVHGQAAVGLAHGLYLTPDRCLTAADLLGLELPAVVVIGACWSSRIDPGADSFALPLVAHARGALDVIGGVYPLPDAPPYPTARLLAQLYPALLGTDPATALWLAQHEA